MKYIKKDIEIDAWQWTGKEEYSAKDKMPDWIYSRLARQGVMLGKDLELCLQTRYNGIRSYLLSPGTWLILDEEGNLGELVNSEFWARYEIVKA